MDYIDLPCHIVKKVESGMISLTHFSDILRAKLISEYGGLWIDATVLCTKPIPEGVLVSRDFFTVKAYEKSDALTLRRWTGFLIGDQKGSSLFSFMNNCFDYYWERNDALIAYLLIDYIIAIAYTEFRSVKTAIDSVPVNNQEIFTLLTKLNCKFDAVEWQRIVSDTAFIKLSYKEEFNGANLLEKTEDGDITYWGYIKTLYC